MGNYLNFRVCSELTIKNLKLNKEEIGKIKSKMEKKITNSLKNTKAMSSRLDSEL